MRPSLVLVTRPEPDAGATAALLRARGYRAVVSPALVATALPVQPLPLASGTTLIVTSPQAARALAVWPLQDYQAIAVGTRTAALLHESGYCRVETAGGTAQAVLALTALQPTRDYCLLGAPSTGQALQQALQAQGHRVRRQDVYRVQPAPALTDEARQALQTGTVSHVLFYSARSARVFLRQVDKAGLLDALCGCTALCLSEAVADAARHGPFMRVGTAASPTAEALQRLLPALDLAHDRDCAAQPQSPGPEAGY